MYHRGGGKVTGLQAGLLLEQNPMVCIGSELLPIAVSTLVSLRNCVSACEVK